MRSWLLHLHWAQGLCADTTMTGVAAGAHALTEGGDLVNHSKYSRILPGHVGDNCRWHW